MRQGGPADIMMRRWVVPDDGTTRERRQPVRAREPRRRPSGRLRGLHRRPDDDPATDDAGPDLEEGLDETDSEYLEPTEWVSVDTDGDGWDNEIVNGTLVPARPRVCLPVVQRLHVRVLPERRDGPRRPEHVGHDPARRQASGLRAGDTQTAAETIPAWHLDIMPDLAVKVDDGTLALHRLLLVSPRLLGRQPGRPGRLSVTRHPGPRVVVDADRRLAEVQRQDLDAVNRGRTSTPRRPAECAARPQHHARRARRLGRHTVRRALEEPLRAVEGSPRPHRRPGRHGDVRLRAQLAAVPLRQGADQPLRPPLVRRRQHLDDDAGRRHVNLDGVALRAATGPPTTRSRASGPKTQGRVFFYDGDLRGRRVRAGAQRVPVLLELAPRSSTRGTRRPTSAGRPSILRKLSLDQTADDAADRQGAYNPDTGTVQLRAAACRGRRPSLSDMHDATTGVVDRGATLAPETSSSAARPDDIRDPSKFFAVYESGDSSPMREGYEADAENLFYSRATNWGDDWEDVLWIPNDETTKQPRREHEPYHYWDWLENNADDKSGEAAVGGSPGGQFFYATWNQWKVERRDRARVRLRRHLPSLLLGARHAARDHHPVADVDESSSSPMEGESSVDGDVVHPRRRRRDGRDLARQARVRLGSRRRRFGFETKGQTVTMVATGAMQHVTVYATDQHRRQDRHRRRWVNSAS